MIDTHIHSKFSADSESDPLSIINNAIAKGLKVIAFTDHFDIHYYQGINMQFNINDYFKELSVFKEEYKNKIKILLGIEVGIQTKFSKEIEDIINKYQFDYIIGSTHLIHGIDPYYGTLYTEESNKKESLTDYFKVIIANIKSYNLFDSMGHIDYVKRYTKFIDNMIYYDEFSEYIDIILKHLVINEKAFEINTSAFDRLPFDFKILKRFKELGGTYVTVGSDSHSPNELGRYFDPCFDLIKSSGFNYITYFENRKPMLVKL